MRKDYQLCTDRISLVQKLDHMFRTKSSLTSTDISEIDQLSTCNEARYFLLLMKVTIGLRSPTYLSLERQARMAKTLREVKRLKLTLYSEKTLNYIMRKEGF